MNSSGGYFQEANARKKKYNFSWSTFYDGITLLEKERMEEEKKRYYYDISACKILLFS